MFLIGCYIAGLRDDVHLDVKIKQPQTLAEAIGVAHLVEERNSVHQKFTPTFRLPVALGTNRAITAPTAVILGPPPHQVRPNGGTTNVL